MAGDASFDLFSGITVLGGGLTTLVGETDPADGLISALQVSGSGFAGSVGVGEVSLPAIQVSGGGQQSSVVLGPLEVVASGTSGFTGQSISDDITLPAVDIVGSGITGRVGKGNVVLGELSVWANSHENNSTIPSIVIEGSGAVGQLGSAQVSIDAIEVLGSGLTQILGSGSITLHSIFATGSGFTESKGAGSVNLNNLIVNANGVVGRVGSASIELPALEISASGNIKPVGYASVELFPLIVNGYGETEVLAPVFKAINLNTRTNAAGEYSNFGYNSMCSFNGAILVASENGIFAITGETDNGTKITSRIKSGITDLNIGEYKRIAQAYIHGTMESGLIMSLITEDGDERKYRVSQANETVKVLRMLTGRGVYSRNWQWGLEGRFKVDQFSIEVDLMSRRIR